ncbi:MAG: ABC transporter ATP-binding protein [Oligoflexia bacterium]|nr:ABC transporter ATP-binding protein [Oligoflexia bacterium]
MIKATKVTKRFEDPPTQVLHPIDLQINPSEFVSIIGKSGSGKTTLLYILSTLDSPSTGICEIGGINPASLSEEDMHWFRNKNIGYVFQFHYLLPELNVLENVTLPSRKSGDVEQKIPYALELLAEFGLQDKTKRLPSQLSGGEQQRVAIARALIMKPKFIFADEPTGNLDTTNGITVMKLLQRVNKEFGATILLVTHEPDYAAMASRQIFIADGKLSN